MPDLTLADIDIFDRPTYKRAVPHDQYALLRREAPVFFQREPNGPGYWAITRHDDISAISRNPKVFSSERGGINIPDASDEDLDTSRLIMISMDPPQHAKYRKLVAQGFTPKMTMRLEGVIREAVDEILTQAEAKLAEEGEIDFVQDIAAQLPLRLIADLIGWPEDERQLMFEWSDRVARIDSDPEDARVAAMEFWGYCADLIEAIEAGERDVPDALLKTLMGAEVDGEKLELMEIVNFMLLLAIGGNETTRNCIAGGFLALHDNPEQLALMRAEPLAHSKIAIEEMLRYISPIIAFRRTTTQPTEIRGQAIPEGAKVVLYYASANRDEEVFENPQVFDIRREKNPHLSFGVGQHFCLGATLARLELQVLFEGLFQRLPNLTPTGDTERTDSNYVNATVRLMVRNGQEHTR